jgi:hypothetical protein
MWGMRFRAAENNEVNDLASIMSTGALSVHDLASRRFLSPKP